jgi:DNA-binding NarL/FixJ family response regulator
VQLVGREKELAAVERAVRDAQEGSSRALGLLGEAGIGKSALLIAARDQSVAAGMLVLEGRGAEHEQDVPFGLVVDALDDHVATLHPRRVESIGPDLEAVLPAAAAHATAPLVSDASAAERFRYHRALRALIEMLARERPVTLLLDDLHWADDASIELVLHLLRRPPRGPHLLAFALRPVDPAPRLLDAARAAPAWSHLQLEPLDREASLELVDDLPDSDLRERVVREAAGNPLFLQELTRAARGPEGELPPTLLAAVQLEVSALPRATRMLLDGAAVVGDRFDPELAAECGGLLAGDALVLLDRLVAADLVRATGDGRAFRFRHPLVRRAVYDAAPPAWRLAAHERAADALERRGASAALRAYHVESSARPGDEDAIALLSEAAAAATDTAPATAARWYAAAERLLPAGEPLRHAMLLGPRALALASAGRLEESHEALVKVLDLLPREPTPQRLALVAACAGLEGVLGRHADAKRRLLAALENAPPDGRATLSLEMAVGAFWRGDSADMREWAEHAAKAAGDDSVLAASAGGLGALGALWQGDPETAYATLDASAAIFRSADDDAVAARLDVGRNLGIMEMHAERFADAEATAARTAEIARRTRQGHALVPLLIVRAMAFVNLLDLESALREGEAAEDGARLQGVPHLLQYALWEKALVHHFRGEALEAERAGAEFRELLPRLEPSDLTRTGSCSVAALTAAEDPERCIADMLDAAGARVEDANPTWSTWLLLVLTRAGIAAGRLDEADDWATRAVDHASALRLPSGGVRGACARAEVLLARDEADAAAELATEAVATADRVGAPRDAAETRLLAGRALAAAGKRPQAVDMLQRAATDAARGCAFQIRDAGAAELRTLGVRLPTAGRGGQRANGEAALSKREREIAELVAEGRSNKQVAAALFLSDRTVEYHLSAVYKKLGVRSRTQLAATLGRAE